VRPLSPFINAVLRHPCRAARAGQIPRTIRPLNIPRRYLRTIRRGRKKNIR
jgi:hypothetical protein